MNEKIYAKLYKVYYDQYNDDIDDELSKYISDASVNWWELDKCEFDKLYIAVKNANNLNYNNKHNKKKYKYILVQRIDKTNDSYINELFKSSEEFITIQEKRTKELKEKEIKWKLEQEERKRLRKLKQLNKLKEELEETNWAWQDNL
jgi:hypothetical protein